MVVLSDSLNDLLTPFASSNGIFLNFEALLSGSNRERADGIPFHHAACTSASCFAMSSPRSKKQRLKISRIPND
jgi:hypothetical protein